MKKSGFLFLFFIFTKSLIAVEPGTHWWPQAGQTMEWTVDSTTNTLQFDGTKIIGSRIATQFGMSAPYLDIKLNFDVTIPATGESTTLVLGSDNGWGDGGSGIIIEISRYHVQALKNFDYTAENVLKLTNNDTDYQALFSADSDLHSVQVDVSATGLITVTVDSYTCPVTYQADVTVLSNPFVLFAPGTTGFRLRNVMATKGDIIKRFFYRPFTGSLYIDAENGNDANSGYSEAEAMKTFNYVNSNVLAAGTKVLLKRGSVWNQRLEIRGSGTVNNWISVGAYGTDPARPKISLTNDPNDIGLLICDLDKTTGVARQQEMNYIEVKNIEISNTRLGIYYRNFTVTQNTGFRVSNVVFNNINCDAVMTAINSALDKNAAISAYLSLRKGNLQTVNGENDGGGYEYVFPAAIFIGGQTVNNQTVSGNHTTALTEFEVNNCEFNEAIVGVMSVFYWPFAAGGGSGIWRQLINKVKISNCTSSGIVNGVIAFDGVNGGCVTNTNNEPQADPDGWGVIKNVRITMGSAVPGRTWPNGTTGVILNNSQKLLLDSCDFSEVLNQGMPDGCGLDFESNNDLITVQNTKFINNDGHSILLMNGGNYGGNTNIVLQKNLFAKNVKYSNSIYELNLGQQMDGSGIHQNMKIRNNVFFMRKKNKNNQDIGFYYTPGRDYVTATDNDLYYLEPTADAIPVSFLGQIYEYNAEISSVALPEVSDLNINNGASITDSRDVQLFSEISKSTPAYCMMSESPVFDGAEWLVYKSSLNFNLSAGSGNKIIYFKVKNAAGESLVKTANIYLNGNTNVFNPHSDSNTAEISVLPNPATDYVKVYLPDAPKIFDYKLFVYSSDGIIVKITNISDVECNLDFRSFNKGLYFIKVVGNKTSYMARVLKK
ncbi:MAG: T9SS type A sorting domain-containing protein [Paludibacter sp.]|nr:T9SS type A sorting domain-containing protein [Paludibacter sp.]